MENNGWQFDLTESGAEIGAGITHNCNPGAFYGYNKDSYKFNEHYVRRQRVYGWANATFNGKGLAVLNIANCNNEIIMWDIGIVNLGKYTFPKISLLVTKVLLV